MFDKAKNTHFKNIVQAIVVLFSYTKEFKKTLFIFLKMHILNYDGNNKGTKEPY